MKNRFWKSLLAVLLPFNVLAQLDLPDTLTPVMHRPPRWVIKFAPLALVDIDNTIQFGAERLFGTRHTVQGEFGYGWRGMNIHEYRRDDFADFEVWRGRAEWRRYSGRYRGNRKPHFATPPIGRYFALEAFFKQLSVTENTSIGRECADGTCAYFERGTFPMYRTVWGLHAKFGRQFVLSMPSDNRFLLDFYVGFGFRRLTPFRFSNSNENVFQFTNTGDWRVRNNGVYPSVTLGIKLGYVL
ncbi:hypothetical protein ACO2Q8_08700 [Larkinella sp. VNQ87]|uniref:hypothetical protein n=1 Tax=Larkinella sp. VNQ87 TaxID=3400921 RepID=UPI003C0B2FC3